MAMNKYLTIIKYYNSLNEPVHYIVAYDGSISTSSSLSGETGWTEITPSVDTRFIYVATSGSDSNSGLYPSAAKATISGGQSLLRDGYPDWLLLNCGDSWDGNISWNTSGRSESEPMVVSSFGTGPRPRINASGEFNGLGHSGGTRRGNVAFIDLHFHGRYGTSSYGNPTGLSIVSPIDNLLIEGCYIERFALGINIGGPNGLFYNTKIRKNVIVDNYSVSDVHAQGVYLNAVSGILVEGNIFETNGHKPGDPNATSATVFRHNVYIQSEASGVTFKDNYSIRGGSHGLQLRHGGNCVGNLFANNSIGALIGGDNDGSNQVVSGNVTIDTGNWLGSALPRGWGYELQNFNNGIFKNNLCVNNTLSATYPLCVIVTNAPGSGVTIASSIWWNWIRGGANGIIINGPASSFAGGVRLYNNHVQENVDNTCILVTHTEDSTSSITTASANTFYRTPSGAYCVRISNQVDRTLPQWFSVIGDTTSTETQITYTDSTRGTLAAYNSYLGGDATYEAFVAALRNQRKGSWDSDYDIESIKNWIRAGWGLVLS